MLTVKFGQITGMSFELPATHAVSQRYCATVTFEGHPDSSQVERELRSKFGKDNAHKVHVDEKFHGITPLYTPEKEDDTAVE